MYVFRIFFYSLIIFTLRYSVIGINSFNSDPDVFSKVMMMMMMMIMMNIMIFSKVTPELKDWILSVTNGAAQVMIMMMILMMMIMMMRRCWRPAATNRGCCGPAPEVNLAVNL